MITINNSIKLKNFGKYKLVTALNTFDNRYKPIFVSTIKENDKFKTILLDNKNNIVGINSFKIHQNIFNGYNMNTLINHNNHTGLGEIMRLTSIIDMLENNLNKIQIFSISNAILFHTKYKFKPINHTSAITNKKLFETSKSNYNKDLPMELTAKDIKANKRFFNQLFAKHKIDYRI